MGRLNCTPEAILKAYVKKNHSDLDVHLPLVLFGYRTLFIGSLALQSSPRPLKHVQSVVKRNIIQLRKQKKVYDCRDSVEAEMLFKVGDRIWLNNTPIPKGRKFHELDLRKSLVVLVRTIILKQSQETAGSKWSIPIV